MIESLTGSNFIDSDGSIAVSATFCSRTWNASPSYVTVRQKVWGLIGNGMMSGCIRYVLFERFDIQYINTRTRFRALSVRECSWARLKLIVPMDILASHRGNRRFYDQVKRRGSVIVIFSRVVEC